MSVIDLHCDTVLFCCTGKKNLHTFDGHINLEKLKAGGCLAQCFALFIPTYDAALEYLGEEREPWELYEQLLSCYRTLLADASETIRPALSAEEIMENRRTGYLSSILTIEDAVELEGKTERLDRVYADGVRMIALTWNYENCIGFPNSPDPAAHRERGLKPFGFEALERMNELGIIADVSHLSEAGFYDVAHHSRKPFAASHSCCRALKDHPRNLTDEQLHTVGETGGVVGINFYDEFLGDRGGYTSVEEIIRHVLHVRDHAGIDSLAFGSDFDGIGSTLEFGDYSGFPDILSALERHFTDDEIDKISYGNFLRVFADQQ
ncbi:MAG: dipeptidase [Oscillospiraceae bacterium]|nr:dipeptidase [Oscillospiraceae bacterium]